MQCIFRAVRSMSQVHARPTARPLAKQITLSETEQRICGLLKDYTEHYNRTNTASLASRQPQTKDSDANVLDRSATPLELRITGGWVRDKLLGQGSHDLDIAINNMTGEQFANGLNEYLNKHYARYHLKPHSIHKIEMNPERSKHLETATTKLFGVEVDFVNLRSEEYTDTTRIPIVKFGTPEQDALRRDATLNALFYNISKNEIEDFTDRGFQDLQDGILRTPLPARQTFLDDPLRVLRLIRFAARFNFKIHEDVILEMKDPEINQAFNNKISRERVGAEVDKILCGPNSELAIHLIQSCHLENVIFFWHSDDSVIDYNRRYGSDIAVIDNIYKSGTLNDHMALIVERMAPFVRRVPLLNSLIAENLQFRENFILASILVPFGDLKIIALPKKKQNNEGFVTEHIIKDGLKLNKINANIVSQCIAAIPGYKNLVERLYGKEQISRSELGIFLRDLNGQWWLTHFISLLHESLYNHKVKELDFKYDLIFDTIHELQLENVHEMKLLIDGKELLSSLKMKGGPWLGKVNKKAFIWQLDNPRKSKEELLEYIRKVLPDYIAE